MHACLYACTEIHEFVAINTGLHFVGLCCILLYYMTCPFGILLYCISIPFCYISECNMTSYNEMSSYQIIPYHIISYHIISYHIISYHI